MSFQDLTIISALFNFFSMIGNLIWSWRLNSIKGNNELISYWKEECEKKDNEIRDLQNSIIKLNSRLLVYQKFHNHKPLALK